MKSILLVVFLVIGFIVGLIFLIGGARILGKNGGESAFGAAASMMFGVVILLFVFIMGADYLF